MGKLTTLLLISIAALAQPAQQAKFKPETAKILAPYSVRVESFSKAAQQGTITKGQADQLVSAELQAASKAAGQTVTAADLAALPAADNLLTDGQYSNAQRKMAKAAAALTGWISLANIAKFIGVVLVGAAVCILFWRFVVVLLGLFVLIPVVVYEFIAHVAAITFIIFGKGWGGDGVNQYYGLCGCLVESVALGYSLGTRSKSENKTVFFAIITALFGVSAVYYMSSMLGYFAVIALMFTMGFLVGIGPLCTYIGFKDNSALVQGTLSGFTVLIAYIVIQCLGIHNPYLQLFKDGSLFMGSFVGYLGLIILGSKWYDESDWPYGFRQLLVVVAGCFALFGGAYLQIPELQRIGGTFFCLWLAEKIAELVSILDLESVTGYAFVALIIGGSLWRAGIFITTHQEFFRQYTLLP